MSRTSQAMSYKVLLEKHPYRYIIMEKLLPNGFQTVECRSGTNGLDGKMSIFLTTRCK